MGGTCLALILSRSFWSWGSGILLEWGMDGLVWVRARDGIIACRFWMDGLVDGTRLDGHRGSYIRDDKLIYLVHHSFS